MATLPTDLLSEREKLLVAANNLRSDERVRSLISLVTNGFAALRQQISPALMEALATLRERVGTQTESSSDSQPSNSGALFTCSPRLSSHPSLSPR